MSSSTREGIKQVPLPRCTKELRTKEKVGKHKRGSGKTEYGNPKEERYGPLDQDD